MPSYSRFASPMRNHSVRAAVEEHALAAARPPRRAGRAPVCDQEQVRLEHALGRHERRQERVGLVGARPRRDQAQPPGHPVDVRVDRHHGHVQAEEQHAARGLRPHAGQRDEPRDRLGRPQATEPVEVGPAVLSTARCSTAWIRGAFCAASPPGRSTRSSSAGRGVAHLLPGREPLAHGCIGTLAVAIARVLAQDREHELVERRQPAVHPRRAVARAQAVEDAVDHGHVPRKPMHG